MTAFLMLPIYTQQLSPTEYGIIGFLAVMLGVYELFLGARFGMALPKFYFDKESQQDRYRLISTALIATAIVSIVGATVFAISSPYIARDFFERADLSTALMCYGLTLLTSSIEEYTLVFLRLKDKPFFFFVVSILKLSLQVSFNLYFLLIAEMGVAGVIYGNVVASGIMALLCGAYTFRLCGFHADIAQFKALLRFAWPLWLSGVAAIYIQFMTNFMLKHFASLEDVGLYHFGQKFATLITLLLWRPFNQWWQTERFKVARHENEPRRIFAGAFLLILSLMCVGAFGISIFSGTVIELMADPEYLAATSIIPVLCVTVVSAQVALFLNFSFLKTEKTGYFPKLRFAKALLLTVLMWVFTKEWQLQGAVFAILLCQLFEMTAYYVIGQKLYNQGIPLKIALFIVFLTAAATLVVMLFVGQDQSFWLRILYNMAASLIFTSLLLLIVMKISHQGSRVKQFLAQKM